jgi:hypothetical protein
MTRSAVGHCCEDGVEEAALPWLDASAVRLSGLQDEVIQDELSGIG